MQGTEIMDTLTEAARQLAEEAIDEVEGGDPMIIADAELAVHARR